MSGTFGLRGDQRVQEKPGIGTGHEAALLSQYGGLANGHGERKMAQYSTDVLRGWGSG